MKQYYFWHWDEPRSGIYGHWGESDWYVEINEDGSFSKKMELYESGDALYYDEVSWEDEYGMLPEGTFELLDAGEVEISAEQFYEIHRKTVFKNVRSA